MKKGSLVVLEDTEANTVLGRVISHTEDRVILKEVGETQSSIMQLLDRTHKHDVKVYPKKMQLTFNLGFFARWTEWERLLPKGWKVAAAEAAEQLCNCRPVDDDDEDEDEDDENEDDES